MRVSVGASWGLVLLIAIAADRSIDLSYQAPPEKRISVFLLVLPSYESYHSFPFTAPTYSQLGILRAERVNRASFGIIAPLTRRRRPPFSLLIHAPPTDLL